MKREEIAAMIRFDTERQMKRTGAHIAVGLVLGSDGSVSECSHLMEPEQAAHLMRAVTHAARIALVEINTGNTHTE